MKNTLRAMLLAMVLAVPLMTGCGEGPAEARRLNSECAEGDVDACHAFAIKLRTGEYVLQDRPRAAVLFEQTCYGGIADGCARLGAMMQDGSGARK